MPHPTRGKVKIPTHEKAFVIEFSSFSGTDVSQMSVGCPGGGVVESWSESEVLKWNFELIGALAVNP